jgi:deoxycytidylate deaminase
MSGYACARCPADHPQMLEARATAAAESLDARMPCGAVVVRGAVVVGRGANGSLFHETHGCQRRGWPSGKGYKLCNGCHTRNHAEATAVDDAGECHGCDLYLWGHYWCCDDCTGKMREAGIARVFLVQGCEELFSQPSTR